MLHAFICAEIESVKNVEARDYSDFYEYFDMAEKAYLASGIQDIEMQNLQAKHEEIVANGW